MFLAIVFSKSSFTRVYFRIAFRAVQESLPCPHSLVRELLPLLVLLCLSVVSSGRCCTHTFFSSHPVHVLPLDSAPHLWTQVCRLNPFWTAAPSSPVSDAAPGGQHSGNGARESPCVVGPCVLSHGRRVAWSAACRSCPTTRRVGGCQFKDPSAE